VRRVFYCSGSCLPTGGGLWSAACPTAPDTASLSGGLRCRHRMPYNFLWTTCHKYKEKPSRHACAARPTYFQRTCTYLQGAWCQGYHGSARRASRHHSQCMYDVRASTTVNVCKTCGQTATMLLQYNTSTADHSPGTTTVQASRQHGATLLIECGVAG
jgi:hypothetical protein